MRVPSGDARPFPVSPIPDAAKDGTGREVSSPLAPPPFARLLGSLDHEMVRGEGAIRSALGAMGTGSEFAPERLLVLQATVYRYSEVVEVASRVVDRATSGIKTVLQSSGS